MYQSWRDLLFAHWPVSYDEVRRRVPAALELESFDGSAWIGVVPFEIRGLRPRGVPALPYLGNFLELNVRTYVRVADQPGVYFFSLDAARLLAVWAARALFHLPYHHAEMSLRRGAGFVQYRSRRKGRASPRAELEARYAPIGDARPARPASLEYFLTERYCLYAVSGRGTVFRVEIQHAPWRLQRAQAELTRNTMVDALGLRLPGTPPLLHFSARQDVLGWAPQRLRR